MCSSIDDDIVTGTIIGLRGGAYRSAYSIEYTQGKIIDRTRDRWYSTNCDMLFFICTSIALHNVGGQKR